MLQSNGHITVTDLLTYRLLSSQWADAEDVRRAVEPHAKTLARRADRPVHKIRFVPFYRNGVLLSVGAAQGHSGRAHRQVEDDQMLQRMTKQEVPQIGNHGTKVHCLNSIFELGLLPGGLKGQKHRQHVHIVEFVSDTGETAGVRGGSDAAVQIDLHKLMDAGAEIFKSVNGVYLTQGVWNGSRYGIGPRFLVKVLDLSLIHI